MRTNINGFNTHLHHESLQGMRKHIDLPDHSIYHVHCECPARYNAGSLEATLCEKLIPTDVDRTLRETLVGEVKVIMTDRNNNCE